MKRQPNMKRNILIISFSAIALIVLAIASIFAWYTNMYQEDTFTLDTNGIIIKYKLDDSENYNESTYSFDNLTPFDIDNAGETAFLANDVKVITILIENSNSFAIACNLKSNYEVKSTGIAPNYTSYAYAECLFFTSS